MPRTSGLFLCHSKLPITLDCRSRSTTKTKLRDKNSQEDDQNGNLDNKTKVIIVKYIHKNNDICIVSESGYIVIMLIMVVILMITVMNKNYDASNNYAFIVIYDAFFQLL